MVRASKGNCRVAAFGAAVVAIAACMLPLAAAAQVGGPAIGGSISVQSGGDSSTTTGVTPPRPPRRDLFDLFVGLDTSHTLVIGSLSSLTDPGFFQGIAPVTLPGGEIASALDAHLFTTVVLAPLAHLSDSTTVYSRLYGTESYATALQRALNAGVGFLSLDASGLDVFGVPLLSDPKSDFLHIGFPAGLFTTTSFTLPGDGTIQLARAVNVTFGDGSLRQVTVVPEPRPLALIALGLVLLGVLGASRARRLRRRMAAAS